MQSFEVRISPLFRISMLFFCISSIAVPCSALNLQESIKIALKSNQTVIAAQKKADAASARFSQAVGAFLPSIKLGGNVGSSYSQPQTVQITTTGTSSAVSFGLDQVSKISGWDATLQQPIFVAGLFPGYQIARKTYDIAKEDLRQAVIDTSFNVIQSYYNLLKAKRNLELLNQAKERAQTHFDRVKTMVDAGAANRSDLLRAQVLLANSDVQSTQAKNGLEIAKNIFNNALGKNLEDDISIVEENINLLQTLPEYSRLIGFALMNRPDWYQYIYTKQINEENLYLAQANMLPSVMFQGKAGNMFTQYPAFKTDVNSWSLAGIASWTIFDGLATQNKIREAAALLDATKANQEQIKNNIILDVRNSYFSLKNAMETIASTKYAMESAEENYKVSDLIYTSGAGTNLEVINAQISLVQAKINYYGSLYSLEVAKAQLNKSVGKEII